MLLIKIEIILVSSLEMGMKSIYSVFFFPCDLKAKTHFTRKRFYEPKCYALTDWKKRKQTNVCLTAHELTSRCETWYHTSTFTTSQIHTAKKWIFVKGKSFFFQRNFFFCSCSRLSSRSIKFREIILWSHSIKFYVSRSLWKLTLYQKIIITMITLGMECQSKSTWDSFPLRATFVRNYFLPFFKLKSYFHMPNILCFFMISLFSHTWCYFFFLSFEESDGEATDFNDIRRKTEISIYQSRGSNSLTETRISHQARAVTAKNDDKIFHEIWVFFDQEGSKCFPYADELLYMQIFVIILNISLRK